MLTTSTLNGTWQAVFVEPGIGDHRRLFVEPLSVAGWFDAQVPGDIHHDLLKTGQIEDPYIADNLERCRWTQQKDCWMYRTFMVPEELRAAPCLEMVFDGLDTIAEVWINDHYLGRCDNMYRQYRFNITDKLAEKEENQLTVKLAALDPARAPYRGQRQYRAIKDLTRIFFRKPQCQFGWDWSPEFGSLGIWRSVWLCGHSGTRIESVQVTTQANGEVTVFTAFNQRVKQGRVQFHLHGHGTNLSFSRKLNGVRTFAALKIPNPQLWYPNGYGEQPLYDCNVSVYQGDTLLDSTNTRFGIREISYQEPRISNEELGWLLQVNGQTVFCQGANWVPPDLFPGATPEERYRALLGRAKEAGFTMLRIWGGGMYEPDIFYDLCDELGLMVWQDFAFANADYPLDQEHWRRNITAEIEYQVCRLRNHPSLAIWCGGNEKSSSFEIEHKIDDGFDLFGVHIPGLLNLLDRTRPYVISSPIAYTDIGNDRSSGNSHTSVWLWAYFDDVNVEPFREYLNPPPAFKSEFFLMGAPRAQSFRRMFASDQVWPPNQVWGYKFRGAPEWNKGQMISFHEYQMNTINKFFGQPNSLGEFLKMSSVCQSELAREEFEFTRCQRARCGGALFWMMNDTWPTATWAIVDFYGVPKPVFYALKRACAPVGGYITLYENQYCGYVINDTNQPVTGECRLAYQIVDGINLTTDEISYRVAPHSAVQIFALPRNEWAVDNAVVNMAIKGADHQFETFYYPVLWKGLQIQDPQLSLTMTECELVGEAYRATVTVRARHFARCVFVDLDPLDEVIWSDNFFDMMPDSERTLTVQSPEYFTVQDLRLGHWLTDWDMTG